MADKQLRTEIKERLKNLGKVYFKKNKSYDAVWLKIKKNTPHLVLCVFENKKGIRICLPWSNKNIDMEKITDVVVAFLEFKKNHSISKQIDILEKELKKRELLK